MSKLTSHTLLYISESGIPKAGRGVFAGRDIQVGDVIEECPVFVFPRKDYKTLKSTALRDYYFMWGKTTVAVCFGYGSLYNHSYQPNATYKKNIKEKTIEFIAANDIKKDEEILVNYNYGSLYSKKELWITSIKPEES